MNSLPQADLQLHLASSYHVQEHKIHSNYETYILSSLLLKLTLLVSFHQNQPPNFISLTLEHLYNMKLV